METEVCRAATLMRLGGEVDAATVDFLAGNLRRFLAVQTPLVVDTAALEYLSTSAAAVFVEFDADARHHDLKWVLVTGGRVLRPVRIADPSGTLPIAESVGEAAAMVSEARHTVLRIVR